VEVAEIRRVAGASEIKKPAFGRRHSETQFHIHPAYQKLSFCQASSRKKLVNRGANQNGSASPG
jgi:hypothetical protein